MKHDGMSDTILAPFTGIAGGAMRLELVDGLEPSTSPLPRECSTAELHEPTWTRANQDRSLGLERETGFEPATFSLGS